uniref:C2H2-type domain-containing protein n=1 Tax=Trichogramma kaykai TaxID=54128 RepID=A0ABD2XHG5_9HYME
MHCSGLFNCTIRVKEEPSNVLLNENDWEKIEKPDLKNFQLLPHLPENSTDNLRKFDKNHDSEFDDEVKIVVECEDVKPNINSLKVEKIDDDSENHLQNMMCSDDYKTENIIKMEPMVSVKQEIVGNTKEKSNLNFDSILVEQIEKERITKKLNKDRNLKTHIDSVHHKITHACAMCGKKFSYKCSLKTHIDSVHNGITHACVICGKKFSTKGHLKIHVDSAHSDTPPTCDICGKTFSSKSNLKKHIDAAHKGVIHICDVCGKKFSLKSHVKIHIDMVHNGVRHACDIWGKKYSKKNSLRKHVDGKHNGVKHECDVCRKSFSLKTNLKTHIELVHNRVKCVCDVCGKKFLGKKFSENGRLKKHIDSMRNSVHACDICQKTFSDKSNVKKHIDSVHKRVRHACDSSGKKSNLKINANRVHQSRTKT